MTSDTGWTGTRIAQLRQLWDEGHSTAEIGRRMGMTKNAVVGKAHRLDLPARPTPIRRAPTGANPARPKTLQRTRGPTLPTLKSLTTVPDNTTASTTPILPTENAPASPVATKRTTIDAKHPCCWPIGEPGARGFRFCDAESMPGKPYCADHAQLAYRKARKDLEAIALQYQ